MTFLDKGGMAHRNIGKKISLFKRERERALNLLYQRTGINVLKRKKNFMNKGIFLAFNSKCNKIPLLSNA